MYAVTTQEICSAPPRSLTMVGKAVETMVWSKAANSNASINPLKIAQMRFFGSSAAPSGAAWPSLVRAA